MNIETLKKYDKKKIIIIITFIVLVLLIILFSVSLAKYRSSKSINIAKGTINYKQPDLNLVSVYLEDSDNNYKQASDGKIPSSGYTLNMDVDKTRCTIKGEVDNNIKITYENGAVSFSKLTTTGTKCYLYFDKIKDTEVPVIGVHEARNAEKNSMDLYVEASDNIGITGYYFKLSTDSDWGEAKCVGQTSCTYSLTDLTANTSYTYDVKVCDESGNCPTTTITQKTKADGIESGDIIAGGSDTADSMFRGTSGNGVYTWTKGDYSGGTQPIKYFRGNVNNNWVVFGKDGTNYIWWRIIRNNSNGSLRMIYAGTSASKTSAPANSAAMLSARAFNPSYDKNYYVGLKYSTDSMHGTTTNAPILGETTSTDKTTLYGWYNATLGKSTDYSSRIDLTAGFCSDRNHSTSRSGPATASAVSAGASTTIYYGSYIRLITNKAPSLLCANASDIFKTPVGLITADEVQMGGMVYGSPANTSSYLYTNSHYCTVSPFLADNNGSAFVFCVDSSGCLSLDRVDSARGVRPVINLKSDTLFEKGGAGTSTNPYIVQGT